MQREERHRPDKTHVVPNPSDPRLFEFIEELFKQDQIPEQIELRQASGRGGRSYGEHVCPAETFKPNAAKPGREKLVALANKFLDLAQHDCDELGSQQGYAVLAKHHARGADYYARFYFRRYPKKAAGEEFDADEENPNRHRDEMLSFMLDHAKQNDENDRLRQDQHSSAVGDILAQQRQIIEMLMEDRREDRRIYAELMKEHRLTAQQLDDALTKKHERELQTQAQAFKLGMLQDGVQFLKSLLPVAVNQLTGKSTLPTSESAESIAIKQFLQGLTVEQSDALFGKPVDGAINPAGGIFTAKQAEIFVSVANAQVPASALDALLEGEHAVSAEQIAQAQQVLREVQFAPLVALVMTRKQK